MPIGVVSASSARPSINRASFIPWRLSWRWSFRGFFKKLARDLVSVPVSKEAGELSGLGVKGLLT